MYRIVIAFAYEKPQFFVVHRVVLGVSRNGIYGDSLVCLGSGPGCRESLPSCLVRASTIPPSLTRWEQRRKKVIFGHKSGGIIPLKSIEKLTSNSVYLPLFNDDG